MIYPKLQEYMGVKNPFRVRVSIICPWTILPIFFLRLSFSAGNQFSSFKLIILSKSIKILPKHVHSNTREYHKCTYELEQQSIEHHRIYPLSMFDLDLGVTQNIAEYPLHNVAYAPATFEVATPNS